MNNDNEHYKAWQQVFRAIMEDCRNRNMTDVDALVAWWLGLSAWDLSQKLGAKFPHSSNNSSLDKS